MGDAQQSIAPRWRRLIALAAAVGVGSSVLGAAISPYLLTHFPTVLLVLSPEPRHVVLTTPLLPAWVILSVGLVRRVLGLVALYLFGWAYGDGAIRFVEERFGAAGIYLRFIQRSVARFGAGIVLVLPMPSVCTLAGVAGTRRGRTLLAMTAGQAFWLTLTWAFGDLLSAFVAPVVQFLADHVIEATVICVVLVVGWQVRSSLKRRRMAKLPQEAPDDAPPGPAQTAGKPEVEAEVEAEAEVEPP